MPKDEETQKEKTKKEGKKLIRFQLPKDADEEEILQALAELIKNQAEKEREEKEE